MQIKYITLTQGSPEWLLWRLQGIGASDIPVLMGLSPYSTPFKLWKEKTSAPKDIVMTEAFALGHAREIQMRAGFELVNNGDFPPACVECVDTPYLRCSLDGWSLNDQLGVEMKFVGKEYYDQEGKPIEEHSIKPDHYAQMQYQMLLMDVDCWVYAKTIDGQNFKTQKILKDMVMQKEALRLASIFWHCVVSLIPPPYTDEDYVPSDDAELVHEVKCLKSLLDMAGKPPKKLIEEVRQRIFSLCRNVRTQVGTCKIAKLEKRKSITYE